MAYFAEFVSLGAKVELRERIARIVAAIEDACDALCAYAEDPELRDIIARHFKRVIEPSVAALAVACGAVPPEPEPFEGAYLKHVARAFEALGEVLGHGGA